MTTPTSAVSPFAATYATQTPYITADEFKAAPTALDLGTLIPNGNAAQQTRAITDTILRASSWVDEICFQPLACTSDVERGRYRVNRDGYISVPLRQKPVLEVTAVKVGPTPTQQISLTDFSNIVVNRSTVEIPVIPLSVPYASQSALGNYAVGDRVIADVTYLNGWVSDFLAAAPIAGATSITLQSGLGVYAGAQYFISDGVNSETFTVANNYTAHSPTVPLAAPLQNTHAVGVSVGNLPAKVKEATILLTTVLIQTRGSDAIVLDTMETPGRTSGSYGASSEDVALAMELLDTLRRAW